MPSCDGYNSGWSCEKVIPGVAACLDDGVVGVVEAEREVILAQILPDVLDRIELGRVGRQAEQREVVGGSRTWLVCQPAPSSMRMA